MVHGVSGCLGVYSRCSKNRVRLALPAAPRYLAIECARCVTLFWCAVQAVCRPCGDGVL